MIARSVSLELIVLVVVTALLPSSKAFGPGVRPTEEEARQAIEDLKVKECQVALCKLPVIMETAKTQIEDGRWYCNLAKRTFQVQIRGSEGMTRWRETNAGVFEQAADGSWRARITYSGYYTQLTVQHKPAAGEKQGIDFRGPLANWAATGR
jgi:hypothetical protein